MAFCERVNAREHRITRRAPAVMLVEERARLHRLPAMPHTMACGQTRKVSWQSTISVGGANHSVPSTLIDERVWARVGSAELVIVHADGPEGTREVARHALTAPGSPSIRDEHYPPRPAGAIERRPRAAQQRRWAGVPPGERAGDEHPPVGARIRPKFGWGWKVAAFKLARGALRRIDSSHRARPCDCLSAMSRRARPSARCREGHVRQRDVAKRHVR